MAALLAKGDGRRGAATRGRGKTARGSGALGSVRVKDEAPRGNARVLFMVGLRGMAARWGGSVAASAASLCMLFDDKLFFFLEKKCIYFEEA